MSSDIPQVTSLSSVYSTETLPTQEARYANLKSLFVQQFGSAEGVIQAVRAPGRVNLIGEHIDYSGYGVLPMAIELDVVIVMRVNKHRTIKIVNTNSKKFPERTFSSVVNSKSIIIDAKLHDWSNYLLSGIKGVLEYQEQSENKEFIGFDALVDGTVPAAAGLSSSSALVCAAALATVVSQGISISKSDLANLCASCERYVGTEGGGMDQAISFLAEKGSAKLIEFNPLRTRGVSIPSGATFVVANSLVEAHKQLTGSKQFNMRVVECRLGAVVIGSLFQIDISKIRKLGQVQEMLGKSLKEMIEIVKEKLHQEPYTLKEISGLIGKDTDTVTKEYLGEVRSDSFELYKRALHVFSEADRVFAFNTVAAKYSYPDQLNDLGALMNQSQESCSQLYNCSCEELDTLTSICRKAGALGSRLTGAGWGGCTVSLVPSSILDTFISTVRDQYYAAIVKLNDDQRNNRDILFATLPGSGAVIYEFADQ